MCYFASISLSGRASFTPSSAGKNYSPRQETHLRFSLPCGHGLQSAQLRFSFPCGQPLQSAQLFFSFPCEHCFVPMLHPPPSLEEDSLKATPASPSHQLPARREMCHSTFLGNFQMKSCLLKLDYLKETFLVSNLATRSASRRRAPRHTSPRRATAAMVRDGTPRGARAADAVGDTAEVVFLGELTGATGFKHTCRGSVLCKYVVVHGEHWHLAKGAVSGATQAAATSGDGGELAPWGHPFQLSFNATSVQVRHTRAPKMGAHAPHAGRPMAPRPTNGPLVARCFRRFRFVSRLASRVPSTRTARTTTSEKKRVCHSHVCM